MSHIARIAVPVTLLLATLALPEPAAAINGCPSNQIRSGRRCRCRAGMVWNIQRRRCVGQRRYRKPPPRRYRKPPPRRTNYRKPYRRTNYRKPYRRTNYRKPVRRPPPRRNVRRTPPRRAPVGRPPVRVWDPPSYRAPTMTPFTSRGRQRSHYCGRKGYYLGKLNGRSICYKGCRPKYILRMGGTGSSRHYKCVRSCQDQKAGYFFIGGRERCVQCAPGYTFNNRYRKCIRR